MWDLKLVRVGVIVLGFGGDGIGVTGFKVGCVRGVDVFGFIVGIDVGFVAGMDVGFDIVGWKDEKVVSLCIANVVVGRKAG